ncbi:MAG: hypothetical protein ACM31C_06425, partial [Acidobacteriota bacterium]
MAQRSEKTIKVCLTNRGADSETPWAIDLGAAPGRTGKSGGRKVKLVNVPFLHAKPTWGDVIVVSPVEHGLPTWDREGVAWKDIGSRITEDGGRWAMIVDYTPHPGDATGDAAYKALARACEAADIVCEGAWGPGKQPGRTYLAVRNARTAAQIMATLREAELPCELIQVHPAPVAAKKASGVRRPASAGKQKKTTKAK